MQPATRSVVECGSLLPLSHEEHESLPVSACLMSLVKPKRQRTGALHKEGMQSYSYLSLANRSSTLRTWPFKPQGGIE